MVRDVEVGGHEVGVPSSGMPRRPSLGNGPFIYLGKFNNVNEGKQATANLTLSLAY